MEATDIVYISAEAIVSLITVIGNSLVLAAIIKTRRLHTITNVFVGNLAIADIAVGVLVAPCAALSFMGLPNNFYGCVFINCLILMFTNISILMLLSVAIERFLAIKEPYLYQRLLTVRRAMFVNLCVWVLGSVLGLMPMYGWHGGYRKDEYCRFTDVITYQYMVYFQFFGLVLLPLFIMLCIYIYILIIVRRHLRQTNALHNRFQQNNPTSDGFHKDVRAAKMFALVILVFGIFWFPVNIFNCVSLFCGSGCNFPKEALLVAIVMSHANSSINPFLYATSNSRIKGAIKGLFGIKLSPDERSSTDHNHVRHTANGTPRARENSIAPISNADDSSNYKDDVRSFAVCHEEFRPAIARMSAGPRDKRQEGDDGIILNVINSDVTKTDIRESLNVNSQLHNLSHQSSNLSLSSLSKAETILEQQSRVSLNPHNKTQQYLETGLINHQEEVLKLFNTPPSSPSLHSHSHNDYTIINGHCNGHSNLAFVNAESLNTKIEDCDHETICDKTDDVKIPSPYENDHIQSVNRQTNDLRSKHKNLWCWEPCRAQEVSNGKDPDFSENVIIYRQCPNERCPSSPWNKFQELNSSSESDEVFMMNRFNDSDSSETILSSLSGHRVTSNEKLEYPNSVEQDTSSSYNRNSEINTGHSSNNKTAFKPNNLADEYGILRNVQTEDTKL